LSKNSTQIPSITNNSFINNKEIINIDDSLNDNLTLTLNSNDFNNDNLNKNSSNDFIPPYKQFTTPSSSKEDSNSLLNQRLLNNATKSLDRGKYTSK